MPSPDFSDYINLTIFDVEPIDIYNEAVSYAKTSLPEFEPRVGTVENAILEAVSYSTAVLANTINRIPDGLMEGILSLMGFTRNESTFATGRVKFTAFDDLGGLVVKGTVVSYEQVSGTSVISWAFETIEDLVIASGTTEAEVDVIALNAGLYPELFATQSLVVISAAEDVAEAEFVDDIFVGSDSETDFEYFSRGSQFLASLNTGLATAAQVSNKIRSAYPSVPVFKVYDLTKSNNMTIGTSVVGCFTVVVCALDGTALTTGVKNELKANLEELCIAGLDISIADMTTGIATITTSIAIVDGYTPANVTADVEDAINSYMSFAGWDFTTTLLKNRLIALVSAVAGVDYVTELAIVSYSNGNATVNGAGNLVFTKKGEVPTTDITVSVV